MGAKPMILRSDSSLPLSRIWAMVILASLGGVHAQEPQDQVSVALEVQHGKHVFELTGIPEEFTGELKELFHVSLAADAKATRATLPMMGTYQREGAKAIFTPRFPLSPETAYRVHLSDSLKKELPQPQELVFSVARKTKQSTAQVQQVYPTSDTLPENLLKFYIHFTEPMKRGNAYDHIQLTEGGKPVIEPFLELGEELWNAEQTRFTLFIHPGRIKRGVKPHEDQGPALRIGKLYTLRISDKWLAANGLPLQKPFEKEFHVTAPDHEQPSLEQWKIETPRSETTGAVVLQFNEALDHAMSQRVFSLRTKSGEPIQGEAQVGNGETEWRFTPESKWKPGVYEIEVAANLEDLAGNSIARPFEVKMQERAAAMPSTRVAIEFVVE